MPGFSGIDLINSLKNDNLLERKNIVILTASSIDETDIKHFLQAGIKAVLKKPLSVEELSNVQPIIQRFRK